MKPCRSRPARRPGRGCPPGRERARFVTRVRAGPPEDVDVPDRPVSQWMYRRVRSGRSAGTSPKEQGGNDHVHDHVAASDDAGPIRFATGAPHHCG